jgi:hypothetical protein
LLSIAATTFCAAGDDSVVVLTRLHGVDITGVSADQWTQLVMDLLPQECYWWLDYQEERSLTWSVARNGPRNAKHGSARLDIESIYVHRACAASWNDALEHAFRLSTAIEKAHEFEELVRFRLGRRTVPLAVDQALDRSRALRPFESAWYLDTTIARLDREEDNDDARVSSHSIETCANQHPIPSMSSSSFLYFRFQGDPNIVYRWDQTRYDSTSLWSFTLEVRTIYGNAPRMVDG